MWPGPPGRPPGTPQAPRTAGVGGGDPAPTGRREHHLHGAPRGAGGHGGGHRSRAQRGQLGHTSYINQAVWNGREEETCDTTGTQEANGYTEAQFAFNVAQYLAATLQEPRGDGRATRTTNSGFGPCITERASIVNNAGAHVAVSIHADGGPVDGRGFSILEPVASGINDAVISASQILGDHVRSAFLSETPMPVSDYYGVNGVVPRDDLGGLNLTTVPEGHGRMWEHAQPDRCRAPGRSRLPATSGHRLRQGHHHLPDRLVAPRLGQDHRDHDLSQRDSAPGAAGGRVVTVATLVVGATKRGSIGCPYGNNATTFPREGSSTRWLTVKWPPSIRLKPVATRTNRRWRR